MQRIRIPKFSGINVVEDPTDAPDHTLARCENLILRPMGAVQRMPVYRRLWNMRDMKTELPAQLGLNAGHGTVLVEIGTEDDGITYRALVAYDMANNKGLGVFYVGDADGNTQQDLLNLPTPINPLDPPPPPGMGDPGDEMTYTLLKSGLAANKRVYFSRIYREIWIGNGVDPNMVYSQTRTPKLRLAGTASATLRPLVSLVNSPAATPAVQATVAVTLADAVLTLTADADNFAGTDGHNIKLRIVNSGTTAPIASTRTGSGSFADPFIYTLTVGTDAATSSGDAILAYLNADVLAQRVFAAALNNAAPAANAALALAQTAFSGGADAVTTGTWPTGFRCKIASCLYDPGVSGERLGYEGPRSALSTEITAFADGKDLLVTIAQKTGADARFTQQRIWMQVYAGPVWPYDPEGPFKWYLLDTVPNSNGSYRVRHDFEALEESAAEPNQGRIPACTMFEFAGDKLWCSGNAAEPQRLWLSKAATATESVPEGCDIQSFLDIEGKKEEPSRPKVTALRKLESRMQVHTDRSITMFESATLRRIVSRSDFGAINPSCLAAWSRAQIPYLGSDGVLYNMNNTQYYRSDPSAPAGWPVLRGRINVREAHRSNLIADATNQLLLIFAPVVQYADANSGTIGCFVVDSASGALTGPHSAPAFISSSMTNSSDNRHIGITETNGDIFVLDLNNLHVETLASATAFTLRAPGYTPSPAGYGGGFPRHTFSVGGVSGYSYDKSYRAMLVTQWLDLDEPDTRKGFYFLEWSTSRGSRAIVTVAAESDGGAFTTIPYGDVYGRERHRVAFCLSGNAVRISIEAIVAEDAPFIMRDLQIGYESQANAGGFFMM